MYCWPAIIIKCTNTNNEQTSPTLIFYVGSFQHVFFE
uniref:Uncharacterized protein n=1 Tax=Utricularia reniformis TaxID=192314 RepID=A0A1Y0AZF6_9LAMI|nr:hypothetical protein AEK19_MT0271 [Utricularia reniformis]ART30547.1 hypothetical protein AEK19_MT0271 [Utricularia reniformis]